MEYIAFDSHKRYTLASVETQTGGQLYEARVEHDRGSVKQFLSRFDPGSPVAVETVGNWYWIVDEIEEAGMVPQLVHARKAKLMLAMVNKTDKLDARGLNRLRGGGHRPVRKERSRTVTGSSGRAAAADSLCHRTRTGAA